jgi:ectoine hydroxylase-related dioxygenase (phytanoyl-CoA dioxygenase family)
LVYSHFAGVATAETCRSWNAAIDRNAGHLSKYSSSLRIHSIPEIELLPGLDCGVFLPWCESVLGGAVVCDLSECWIRRQYAPANYPPQHAPHSWHQDGALRFDFEGEIAQNRNEGLLEMVTCWIALAPCGVDAPGLELIAESPGVLVAPANLTEERIRTRFPGESFVRPALYAGDALLFRGDVLHRTHVNSSMTRDRTSVELRLFPADRIPPRLTGDEFVRMNYSL